MYRIVILEERKREKERGIFQASVFPPETVRIVTHFASFQNDLITSESLGMQSFSRNGTKKFYFAVGVVVELVEVLFRRRNFIFVGHVS